MVYEYKYVIINYDGHTPGAWQHGSNGIIALQWGDEEVEVFDNWWVSLVEIQRGAASTLSRSVA